MNRRHLLKLGSAALASSCVAGRLFAAPTSGPRFLMVFLRGGYDSTNLLIPIFEQFSTTKRDPTSRSRNPTHSWLPARSS